MSDPSSDPRSARATTWLSGGAAVGALGTALTAAAAGLCCAGPLTIVLLGAGGAVAAAGLKPYRLPLLGASLLLIGVAVLRAYRPGWLGGSIACPVAVGRLTRVALWTAVAAWCCAAVFYAIEFAATHS